MNDQLPANVDISVITVTVVHDNRRDRAVDGLAIDTRFHGGGGGTIGSYTSMEFLGLFFDDGAQVVRQLTASVCIVRIHEELRTSQF